MRNVWEDMKKKGSFTLLVGMQIGAAAVKNIES